MALDLNDPETKKAIEDAAKNLAADMIKEAVEKEVLGLKTKNDELLGKMKEKANLPSPELLELEEFRKSKEKAEEAKLLEAGEFENIKKQILEKHDEEMKLVVERETGMKNTLDTYLIEGAAVRAISEAKGSTKLLLPHVKNSLKVVDENGAFVARVVNSDGSVRIGDNKGAPMTIGELLTTMKKDESFMAAFEGTGANGGGAQGNTNGQGSKNTLTRSAFENMDAGEKMSFSKGGGVVTNDA